MKVLLGASWWWVCGRRALSPPAVRGGLRVVKIWSAAAVLGAELVVLVWRVGVHAWDVFVPALVIR